MQEEEEEEAVEEEEKGSRQEGEGAWTGEEWSRRERRERRGLEGGSCQEPLERVQKPGQWSAQRERAPKPGAEYLALEPEPKVQLSSDETSRGLRVATHGLPPPPSLRRPRPQQRTFLPVGHAFA